MREELSNRDSELRFLLTRRTKKTSKRSKTRETRKTRKTNERRGQRRRSGRNFERSLLLHAKRCLLSPNRTSSRAGRKGRKERKKRGQLWHHGGKAALRRWRRGGSAIYLSIEKHSELHGCLESGDIKPCLSPRHRRACDSDTSNEARVSSSR